MTAHVLTFADTGTAADDTALDTLPRMTLVTPLDGSASVSPETPIVLQMSPGLGYDTDLETVIVTVDDVVVWEEEAPQNGWTGVTETLDGLLQYRLYPPRGLAYGAAVTVETTFEYEAS